MVSFGLISTAFIVQIYCAPGEESQLNSVEAALQTAREKVKEAEEFAKSKSIERARKYDPNQERTANALLAIEKVNKAELELLTMDLSKAPGEEILLKYMSLEQAHRESMGMRNHDFDSKLLLSAADNVERNGNKWRTGSVDPEIRKELQKLEIEIYSSIAGHRPNDQSFHSSIGLKILKHYEDIKDKEVRSALVKYFTSYRMPEGYFLDRVEKIVLSFEKELKAAGHANPQDFKDIELWKTSNGRKAMKQNRQTDQKPQAPDSFY